MMTRSIACALLTMLGTLSAAAADTKVTVSPATVRPGDPVLVTVTGTTEQPKGTQNGVALEFFPARVGYQAVFAVPLDAKPDTISVEIQSAVRLASVKVTATTFPESKLIVEDELASPPKADRDRIDADNAAIIAAAAKAKRDPQFVRPFRRPPGEVTSVFGEWRTFNDGHRAQHLGLDLAAREGSPVAAIDDGIVALVRDTFLAGTVVVISHGGGISSLYFHLSKVSVAEGDTVTQGKEIGRAGHTGRTTGPHLHVSIHVPGGLVDPTTFFKLNLVPATTKVSRK